MSTVKFGAQGLKSVLSKGLFWLAIFCLGIAVIFGWSGFSQQHHAMVEHDLLQARDQVIGQIEQQLSSATSQFKIALRQPAMTLALNAGDSVKAAALIRSQIPHAQNALVFDEDFNTAYEDLPSFGYGRLGLLEVALISKEPQIRFIHEDNQIRFGMAANIALGTKQGVAYVSLPSDFILMAVKQILVPATSYLAFRQDGHTFVQQGDTALSSVADLMAKSLEEPGLRVVAALPDSSVGPMGLGVKPCLVITAISLLCGLAGLVLSNKRFQHWFIQRRQNQFDPNSMTLAASLSQRSDQEHKKRSEATLTKKQESDVVIHQQIFHVSGIHGLAKRELTPAMGVLIGQAIGSMLHAVEQRKIVIGHDGRLGGKELMTSVSDGLRHAGCEVVSLNEAPTPVIFFAAEHLKINNGVSVTGGCLPSEYNGIQIMIDGVMLYDSAIHEIKQRITDQRLHVAAEQGAFSEQNFVDPYVKQVTADIQLLRPLKIVIDAGHGSASLVGPKLLQAIGATVTQLCCEIDGQFPSRQPDPYDVNHLEDLVTMVKRLQADLGVAFDSAGQRLAVVNSHGKRVQPDRIMTLMSQDVLNRNPGALILFDVHAGHHLADHIVRSGGSPQICRLGSAVMQNEMIQTSAEFGATHTGEYFIRERWFSFCDGLYACARLLELLAQQEKNPADVFSSFPDNQVSTWQRVAVQSDPQNLVKGLVELMQQPNGSTQIITSSRMSTVDGVRIDYPDGWSWVRAEQENRCLVFCFGYETLSTLQRIRAELIQQLNAFLPEDKPIQLDLH